MIDPKEMQQKMKEEPVSSFAPAPVTLFPSSRSSPSSLQQKIQRMCQQLSDKEALQDNFELYIPVMASRTPPRLQDAQGVFDLRNALDDFVRSDKRVMLLQGEVGSGKSLSSQIFIMEAAEHYREGDRIPLFISLPTLQNPMTALMQEALQRFDFNNEEIAAMQKNQSFLLMLDAYDEINQLENLYIKNQLSQWKAKIIITCRTTYLASVANYQRYFIPYSGEQKLLSQFQELYVAPFVSGQINEYIKQYLTVKHQELEQEIFSQPELTQEWLEVKTYQNWIGKIGGLKDLVTTPFLLRITMEVMPAIVAEYQADPNPETFKMTQAKLYDAFIKRWFTREEDRRVGLGEDIGRTFQQDCYNFAERLARMMQEQAVTQVTYEETSVLSNPNVENPWDQFFSEKMVLNDRGDEKVRQARTYARRACPLRKVGRNQFAFLHASLIDYFVTHAIYKEFKKNQPIAKPILNPAPQVAKHPQLGEFALWDTINRSEAQALLKEEGIKINFQEGTDEIYYELARGTFGVVYIGEHEKNHRFAAIKRIILRSEIEKAKKEAEIQFQLKDLAYIMPIWHTEELTERQQYVLYQVMPLASFGNGKDLLRALKSLQDESLKQKILIYVAKCLLTGIKNMHRNRTYHLDIRPENFVMSIKGALYIIDFGCSVRKYGRDNDHLLSTGSGHPNYISPDRLISHIQNENYDAAKTDMWAAGVTLLEIALGQYPLGNENIMNRNEHYFKQQLQSITELQQLKQDSLWAVIAMLLDLNPKTRYHAEEALAMPVFHQQKHKLSDSELENAFRQLKNLQSVMPKDTYGQISTSLAGNIGHQGMLNAKDLETLYPPLPDAFLKRGNKEKPITAESNVPMSTIEKENSYHVLPDAALDEDKEKQISQNTPISTAKVKKKDSYDVLPNANLERNEEKQIPQELDIPALTTETSSPQNQMPDATINENKEKQTQEQKEQITQKTKNSVSSPVPVEKPKGLKQKMKTKAKQVFLKFGHKKNDTERKPDDNDNNSSQSVSKP